MRLPMEIVLFTPAFAESEAGRALASRLAAPPTLVAPELLAKITDADSPRGVLAVTRLRRGQPTERAPRALDVWIYLDRIQDPGNLGALARVCEGLGATGLLLSPGCADPNHPRALRASAGSLLRLPVFAGVEAAAAKVWSAGARWIGLEAHAGARSPEELRPGRPFVLALGAEGAGLSDAVRERLDDSVTLPLLGRLESLNVAVACALALDRMLPGRGRGDQAS